MQTEIIMETYLRFCWTDMTDMEMELPASGKTQPATGVLGSGGMLPQRNILAINPKLVAHCNATIPSYAPILIIVYFHEFKHVAN